MQITKHPYVRSKKLLRLVASLDFNCAAAGILSRQRTQIGVVAKVAALKPTTTWWPRFA